MGTIFFLFEMLTIPVCGWCDEELLRNLLVLLKPGTISLFFKVFYAFVTAPLILSLKYSGVTAIIAETMSSFNFTVGEKKNLH